MKKIDKNTRLLLMLSLAMSGIFIFTVLYIDSRNKRTELNHNTQLAAKGAEIRNKYKSLQYGVTDHTHNYRIPEKQLLINSDEDIIYTYDSGNQPSETLHLSWRGIFDNLAAIGSRPECAAVATVEHIKRAPKSHEAEPITINLEKDKASSADYYYVYTPKLGICKEIYSDEVLVRVSGDAMSLKHSY